MFQWLIIAGLCLIAFVFQVRAKNWFVAGLQAALTIGAFAQAYAHWVTP